MSGDSREEVGPYIVYEQLGSGGMATVHRAEQRGIAGFRRVVALKRLHANVAADPDLLKSFIHEARLASYLKHANVAQTFDLGKVGDTYFIAMEFVAGPTLAQLMRQCTTAAGPIPLAIVLSVLIQICDALDHAHNLCDDSGQALRIIHRDVSPSNVIISNSGTVKLIDFGIAKANNSDVRTQTGMIKGKFGYIAPEYLTGQLDPRGDLFGVGVIAHELIAGRSLFLGRNDFDTLNRLRDMPILPPSHWNRDVTPVLDDIVLTALQRDPERRWQSASAMRTALHNAARDFGSITAQQVCEWIEWAFTQLPQLETSELRHELDGVDDPSMLIDFGRPSASSFGSTPPAPAPLPTASTPGGSPPSGFAPDVLPASAYAADAAFPPTSPGFAPGLARRAARAQEELPPSAFEPTTPPATTPPPDLRGPRESVPTFAEIPREMLPASAFAPEPARTRSRSQRHAATPPPAEALPPEVLTPSAFAPELLPPPEAPVSARTRSRSSQHGATPPPEALPPETLPASAFAPETLPASDFAETPPSPSPLPPHLLAAPPVGPPVDPAVKLAAAVLAPALPAPVSAPKLVSAPQSSAARAKATSTPPVMVARDKPPSAPPPVEARVKQPTAPPPVPAGAAKPPPVPPGPPATPGARPAPPTSPPPVPAGAAKPPPVPPGARSKSISVPPPIPGTPSPAKPPPVPPAARAGASGTKPPPVRREPEGDSLGATEPHLSRYDSLDATDPISRAGELDETDPVPLDSSHPGDADTPVDAAVPRRQARSLEELAGLPAPRWSSPAVAAAPFGQAAAPPPIAAKSSKGASDASLRVPDLFSPEPPPAEESTDEPPALSSKTSKEAAKEAKPAKPAKPPKEAKPAKPAKPPKDAKPTKDAKPPKDAKPARDAKPAKRVDSQEEAERTGGRWWVVLLLLFLAAGASAAAVYYFGLPIDL